MRAPLRCCASPGPSRDGRDELHGRTCACPGEAQQRKGSRPAQDEKQNHGAGKQCARPARKHDPAETPDADNAPQPEIPAHHAAPAEYPHDQYGTTHESRRIADRAEPDCEMPSVHPRGNNQTNLCPDKKRPPKWARLPAFTERDAQPDRTRYPILNPDSGTPNQCPAPSTTGPDPGDRWDPGHKCRYIYRPCYTPE